MKICAIVGAGEFYKNRFDADKYDFIIAADGGADTLLSIGITPDLAIGDFDSGSIPDGVEAIRHNVEKDETDMHLALLEGVRRGYDTFYIFGGVGGRPDHTFANYCLLYYAKSQGVRAYLMDESFYSFVIENEAVSLVGRCDATLSVFAFGANADGVSVKNTKYEADGITLSADFPLGVSNSFTDAPADICVSSGALLIMAEYQ